MKIKHIIFSLLFFLVNSGYSQKIIHDFTEPVDGIEFKNITSDRTHDNTLKANISEENKSWKAKMYLNVNQDVFAQPIVYLKYKVNSQHTLDKVGLTVIIKIDGIYGKNGDSGTWRLYPTFNAVSNEWEEVQFDLSPLITSWKNTHGNNHGNIQEIKIDVGTSNLPFFGDIEFDYIKIGEVLSVSKVELDATSTDKINVFTTQKIQGQVFKEHFEVKKEGVNQLLKNVDIINDTTLAIELQQPIEVPLDVMDIATINVSYNGLGEVKSQEGNEYLKSFTLTLSYEDYGENLWKYWGKFQTQTYPYPQPWSEESQIIDGWDWSLPPNIKADDKAYFKYKDLSLPEFSCKNLASVLVRWDELEPTEGNYDFELLKNKIKESVVGHDGVVLRLLSSVWKIDSYPVEGQSIPKWLEERKNAPRWMDDLPIAKIPMHKAIDNKYLITNMDIMDEEYHSRYLRFIRALGNSGIPEMEELKLVNVCYRSASAGEEFTKYNIVPNHHVESQYSEEVIAQRSKERLNVWSEAFGDHVNKLLYVGHDKDAFVDHAGDMGIGTRSGFIEVYTNLMHAPELGIFINQDRYMEIDEENNFIKNNLPFGDENEEYDNEYRFGWKESFPYRYYIASFRMMQMRRNYVMHDDKTLNPTLTWYVGMGLSRNIHNSPDAWALLSEMYISPFSNKNEDGSSNEGEVKNIERWLYQRDKEGYETTPCMKVPVPKILWSLDKNKPYEYTARKGKKMGFDIDNRFFNGQEYESAIKVTYYDGVKGNLKLVYHTSKGEQYVSITTTGQDLVKTATFMVDIKTEISNQPFDFEIHSEEEVPIFFVRIIKLQETNNDDGITNKNSKEFSSTCKFYPNPFKNEVKIESQKNINVSVFDQNLKVIFTGNVSAYQPYIIDTSTWSNGLYYLKTSNGETFQIIKN
ncbi:T9SS type A sorting domain-containing protein [Flammeovirga sp. MY04]|uniref:T9SS type A sorting domain-containing protein n=1 Tax=Flammeovirga sp. MY04 TaxID=1191459 RepID=UPI0008249E2B|nr:T9SS type A sorting domain-containing protein [Flammeovirga sp. MY04]ANQ52570.2 T9SS type A sorting domain-containing protein [Flammeovirga sp. MY04]